ncbi:chemotaxis protein [Ideonella sp. 4Y16]|uniref:Chemotaxis protein n=1 Tax=Ideonella alba TaxID=2824118 RepID=A0A940YAP5_9BURK|nr:methyl-accepting chemotaxis protein [Ideonella alba]MBQ0932023.1 chemotaxis protein [Ideonella alba]MBQ0945694.1 chemotaxis protein [Ideonella alba]
MASSLPPSRLARQADRLILLSLLASVVMAVGLGVYVGQPGLALGAGLPLALLGTLVALGAPGSLASRLVLSATLMSSVALHIQLARGLTEMHFGVFVTLAFLLAYRDWRPLVLAAGVIAVHHVVFDRLQAAGLGTYCLAEPDLMRVMVHAGYVVVQTALEVYLATLMRSAATQGQELESLVEHLGAQGRIALDVQSLPARTSAAAGLKTALLSLGEVLKTVGGSIASIQTASSEIASGSLDLSGRTEQAAGQLQQTASAMVQLSGAVQQTAESARVASQLAAGAAEVAGRGGQVVADVVTTMGEINQASKRIADIIGVIDGIAFQTNILALNAAVEAARAGEQGRGFAVVAGEVRSLAGRSAEAAREIKQLIGDSVQKVDAGAQLVGSAGTTMDEIVAAVQRVSDIIRDITAATQAQSEGIAQVNGAVHQLDASTQQNAALVEQSSAAAESLRQQAGQLAQAMQGIRAA